MAKKVEIKAIDDKGQLFVADDNSAFRLETQYTKNKIRPRELERYFHDAIMLLESAFKNEEINLAAYLVLSRYAGRHEAWAKHDHKGQEAEVWDMPSLIEKAKAKKNFRFLGIRQK